TAWIDNGYAYRSFAWTIANGVLDGPANGSYVSFHQTGPNPVQLSVTATDYSGCTAAQTTSIPLRTANAPTISQSGALCPNGTSTMASVNNAYAYSTFSWSILNGAF